MGTSTSAAPRLLLVHGDIYGFGGAEMVALRMLHSLQQQYSQITLIHAGGSLDPEQIERRSGLRIDPGRVRFLSASLSNVLTPPRLGNWALIKYAVALRHASRIAADHSAVITTYGECPFPHPRVLQYIHYPQFGSDRASLEHLGATYSSTLKLRLRQAYVHAGRAIAGWNPGNIRQHEAVANSHWTGEQFRRIYDGGHYRVLYPGTEINSDPTSLVPFEQRDNDFVMLGRIVPAKRIDMAIAIVKKLREERGHAVGLDIIGNPSPSYAGEWRQLLEREAWVRWHPGLARKDLERLVSTKKWGLHCFEFEHYGIAPAELQQLGCVVFVPDSGGQCEIVTNPGLRYASVAEAVERIDGVLRAPEDHPKLLAQIAQSSQAHRSGTFEKTFLEMVNRLLGR